MHALQVAQHMSNTRSKIHREPVIVVLTSGPGEELLEELGYLLEEGKECLKRLLWAWWGWGGAAGAE